tara:strand:- start:389 stop:868 length:480 start_codon:yes stop_codon:yes gene_type:complete
MDYSNLNSFLGNLEIKTENKEFLAKNSFNDSSIDNKPRTRKQIENLLVNRNNELTQFQNGNFNFESMNPQRLDTENTRFSDKPVINSSNKYNEDYELNRNLQVNNIVPRHINLMDYSQFSENYKSSKNSLKEEDNLNKKLSSRDNIPNISSVPSNLWDK